RRVNGSAARATVGPAGVRDPEPPAGGQSPDANGLRPRLAFGRVVDQWRQPDRPMMEPRRNRPRSSATGPVAVGLSLWAHERIPAFGSFAFRLLVGDPPFIETGHSS